MAALAGYQCVKVWSEGIADRVVLYAFRNTNAGDTFDSSADFSVVKRAVALGVTVNGAAAATASGVTITLPSGLAADAGYILAWGCSS